MRLICCALAFVALVAAPGESFGQEAAASLHGRAVDTGGKGLAGVTVTVQSPSLAGPLTTQTTASGSYGFSSLPPGTYVVAFARTGLVTVKQTMRLSVAEAAQVRVVMHPENGTDRAITVTAERQVFPPSWSTSLFSRYGPLEQLPVSGTARSVIGLVTELPGVRPEASLFLFDGLPLRHHWNAGPQISFVGPGSEALREVSVTPGRLPAGHGRLEAGSIELVTGRAPSGISALSGSFRAAFDGGDLNADLIREARGTDGLGTTAEYTLGGALVPNRIWFFGSGRHLKQTVTDQTALSFASFETRTTEQFGLGKATIAANARHRLEGQWIGVKQKRSNAAPLNALIAGDTDALDTQTISDRVFSAAYIGRFGRGLDLSIRATREDGQTRLVDPAQPAELSLNVQFVDQLTGAAWAAPGACLGCEPQTSRHETLRATLGTAIGSHYITLGVDGSRNSFSPIETDAGGNYQIRSTRTALVNGVVVPVIEPNAAWLVWFPELDQRLRVRSEAAFISDRWLVGDRLTFDLGLRAERNRVTWQSDGRMIVSERGLSPRIHAAWRPSGTLPWTVRAGFGRYIPDLFERGLDTSLWNAPVARAFLYSGPSINTAVATLGTSEAANRVFTWFLANGSIARTPAFVIDSRQVVVDDPASPPRVDEWSFGLGREIGQAGHATLDVTRRTYDGFDRQYTGITAKAKYRFGHYADIDTQYTFSRSTGETNRWLASDPISQSALVDPALVTQDWLLPSGALPEDSRHRFRLWAHTELMAHDTHGMLIVMLVHSRESGRPYGAVGLVGVGSSFAPYSFTEPDAFRTDAIARTDLGFNYRRRLPGTIHGDLFFALHMLNIFSNDTIVHPERLTFVRTGFTDPSLQRFNPLTQTPVEGVHWVLDRTNAQKDTAAAGVPMTMGRTIRLVMGIRF